MLYDLGYMHCKKNVQRTEKAVKWRIKFSGSSSSFHLLEVNIIMLHFLHILIEIFCLHYGIAHINHIS